MQNKLFQITDSVHETIYLSGLEKELMSTPYFNRLHDVYQSSTVYMTFPSNRTKRYEHSLGTMQLTNDIFFNAFANADLKVIDDFFIELSNRADIILNKLSKDSNYAPIEYGDNAKKIIDSYKRKQTTEYIQVFTENYTDLRDIALEKYTIRWYSSNDYRNILYNILLQAARIVGLLHDIGHPPYSHIIESALKEIYNDVAFIREKTERQQSFYEILSNFIGEHSGICDAIVNKSAILDNTTCIHPDDLHESIGLKLTHSSLQHVISNRLNYLPTFSTDGNNNNIGFSKIIHYTMLYEFVFSILLDDSKFWSNIHNIISSVFDADRMDYVMRDAKNCGLHWCEIPYKRLINSAKLQHITTDDDNFFCISYAEKNVDVLNDILNTRYKIFTQVNNHHKSVKMATLLQNSIKILSKEYLYNNECDTDDAFNNISGLWRFLEEFRSDSTYIYNIMNWNDSWLMNLLRCELTKLKDFHIGKEELYYCLDELLLGNKHFYSVIKRSSDIQDIYSKSSDFLADFLKNLEIECTPAENNETQKYLKYITSSNDNYANLNIIMKWVSDFDVVFVKSLNNIINNDSDFCIKYVKETKIKLGISEAYLYSNLGKIKSFSSSSFCEEILEIKKSHFPYAYSYVVFNEDFKNNKNDKINEIKEKIAKQFAEELINEVNKKFST